VTSTPRRNAGSCDSGNPYAALTLGNDGNFYGTTQGGGITNSTQTYGMGTVFQWYFNGTPFGLPAAGTNFSSCTLTNIGSGQAGNYSAEVVNGYGSVMSSNATLTVVNLPPTITTQPANRTNNAGTTATFSVAASSLSPLSYQWLKNGTNLANGGRLSGATNSTLTITIVLECLFRLRFLRFIQWEGRGIRPGA
jgi:hypothetical protein